MCPSDTSRSPREKAIVNDEQTKNEILEKFEKARKFFNIFFCVLILTSVTFAGVMGDILYFVIGIIGLWALSYFRNKSLTKITSSLEPYEGPDLWTPP